MIDSESASGGIVILADAIQRRLDRGTTDEEIEELVERFRRDAGLLFTVDTLDYLVRGGRVGKAAGFAGQLLNVKPILDDPRGEVEPAEAGARPREGARRVRAALRRGHARTRPTSTSASRTRTRREEADELAARVCARRGRARRSTS